VNSFSMQQKRHVAYGRVGESGSSMWQETSFNGVWRQSFLRDSSVRINGDIFHTALDQMNLQRDRGLEEKVRRTARGLGDLIESQISEQRTILKDRHGAARGSER
jgi:hypothetical protein